MKAIKAIVKPFRLEAVIDALRDIPDVPSITVLEVRGIGRRAPVGAQDDIERGDTADAAKAQVELVVSDGMADQVIDAIRRSAHTGNPGDGKIFVSDVADAIRIRSGERGNAAL